MMILMKKFLLKSLGYVGKKIYVKEFSHEFLANTQKLGIPHEILSGIFLGISLVIFSGLPDIPSNISPGVSSLVSSSVSPMDFF